MLSTLFNTPFDTLTREMDRMFERVQTPAQRAVGLNAWRDADDVIVEAEVPGFRLEDLHVAYQHGTLTVRGERADEAPEDARTLRNERALRRFERRLRLPLDIEDERIDATLTNGVLRIIMPVAESAKPRRIEVKAIEPAKN